MMRSRALAPDAYDIAGYRVLVGATPSHARTAVRGILRGFGPIDPGPTHGLPRYDLAPAGERWHIRRDGTAIQVEGTLPGALGVLEWHVVAAALDHRRDLLPADFSLQPLRRAFHVSDGTWRLLRSLPGDPIAPDPETPAEYFSPSRWASEPAPVKWLLLVERGADRRPQLLPLSTGEATAAILARSSTLTRSTRLALRRAPG